MMGNQITVNGDLKISDTDIGSGKVKLTYKFTDIYNEEYWAPCIEL